MSDMAEYALRIREVILLQRPKFIGNLSDWDIAWTLWAMLPDGVNTVGLGYYEETTEFVEHWNPFR